MRAWRKSGQTHPKPGRYLTAAHGRIERLRRDAVDREIDAHPAAPDVIVAAPRALRRGQRLDVERRGVQCQAVARREDRDFEGLGSRFGPGTNRDRDHRRHDHQPNRRDETGREAKLHTHLF